MAHEFPGVCPCCEQSVVFRSENDWYRDYLQCPICHSVVRERALALVLAEILPHWRTLSVHESSPAPRGISVKLQEAPDYTASHFFKDRPLGSMDGPFRNENLEAQTFPAGSFDLVVTLDVMEHVGDPAAVYREIWRTLKPGGYYLHTFPVRKWQTDAAVSREGKEPEYHGNPIDGSGSLVTFDYGYDISRQIAQWAPFDVRVLRFWDQTHGIMGEYTEVFVCRKRD